MKTIPNKIYLAFALFAFACFTLSSAMKADPGPTSHSRPFVGGPPIVGLWQVEYTGVACDQPVLPSDFFTYQQFHRDGLEIESPMFSPGQCQGVWEHTPSNTVSIYHVGWTPAGVPGFPQVVRFVFTETLTVSVGGNSFDGSVDQTFYDAHVGGNVIAHCTETTHATRLPAE